MNKLGLRAFWLTVGIICGIIIETTILIIVTIGFKS